MRKIIDNHTNTKCDLDERFDRIIGFDRNRFWFTTQEAAEYLGVSLYTLIELRAKNSIEWSVFGKRIYHTRTSLDKIRRSLTEDRRAMI